MPSPSSFLPSSWLKAARAEGRFRLWCLSQHIIMQQYSSPVSGRVTHSISSVIGTSLRSSSTHVKWSWSSAQHRRRFTQKPFHYPNNLKRSSVYSCYSELVFFSQLAALFTSCILFMRQTQRKRNYSPRMGSPEPAGWKPGRLRVHVASAVDNIGSDEWNMKAAQTVAI